MRQVILPFLILLTLGANARNFYVSASGSDSNDGLTVNTPWKSISKVNASFSIIAAGDSILFRRGDVFYGALVVGKSGSSGKPIVISAYGTAAAKPLFTGFTAISSSSWTLASTGIYQTSVPAAKVTLNMVLFSGKPQQMGRYPNIDAANGGYLNYESFSGYKSITDNELTSTTNWTGAEAVIRKNSYVMDRCRITAQSGTTITYTSPTTEVGTAGFGYFIQDHPKTLDQLGEWYLNKTTKQLQMYFGTATPSAYSIKVGTIDTLININGKNYITVDGIAMEGANANAMQLLNCTYVNILNCDIRNSWGGLYAHNCSNFLVDNVTTNNTYNNGIFAMSLISTNTTIRNCTIKNNGTVPGMGGNTNNGYTGMRVESAGNLLVEYNRFDSIGYVGIQFQGNDVMIRNNFISNFDLVKQDGGGIYTHVSGTLTNPGPTYYRRTVRDNIILNGIGAPYGTKSGSPDACGIFLDGRTMNVDVIGNTVASAASEGIQLNNPVNVTVRNNTLFDSKRQLSICKWAFGDIKNVTIKGNVVYTKNGDQKHIHYLNTALNDPATTTIDAALKAIGSIDSNYYSNVNQIGFNTEVYGTTGGAAIPASPRSMESWANFSTYDIHSKKAAKLPTLYKVNSLIGANKFTNGTLSTTISGLTIWGSNVTAVWDGTGKISGGSVKLSFSAPAPYRYGTVHSPVGAISSSKKYLLRVTTLGTTVNGIIRGYIRQTASPYTELTPIDTRSFGTTAKTHEFLFNAPTSSSAGSFVIDIEQNSGTTYLDNIEFYEVDAAVYDFDKQLRFEYNDTKNSKTVSLGANYRGVDGALYSGTITLKPFASAILVQDTGTVVSTPSPVTSSLLTSSTSGKISCYGGTANVTVSASGGKSPYTGTGSFAVSAGKGSLAISAKQPTPGQFTYLYYTIGAVKSTKNYVLKFSTIRNSGTATLKALIRQTRSPWADLTPKQQVTIGTSRIDHEFYFTAPTSDDAASFRIDVEQASGITYIDNIAFFEVDAAKNIISDNLYPYGQFETDISNIIVNSGANANFTAVWDNTSKINSIYYFPVKDAGGAVTVAQVKTSQPAAALKAIATTSSAITTSGGTTTVTVSATGGTAPYKGTGSFVVGTGTYSYTITDANGCSATAKLSISLSLAKTTVTSDAGTIVDSTSSQLLQRSTTGQLNLTASPNPTTSSFNLYVQGGTAEKVMVTVYNADGRIFYQTTGTSNTNYTFGSSFTQGIYFVKVVQGNTVQTLKLVKSI